MPIDTNPGQGSEAISFDQAMSLLIDREAVQANPDDGRQAEAEAPAEVEADATEEALDADSGEEAQTEQSEDEGEQPESEEQPRFTVKIDGKEQVVTLDELQAGYQRNADYTRKTQEAADLRKAAEAELTTARQAREQHAQALGQLHALLSQPEKEPDLPWDTDPVAAARMSHEWRNRQEQRRIAAAEVAEQQRQMQAQAITEARKRLPEFIPEWRDEQVATREKQAVIGYAQRVGYTPQEIGQATDPRAIKVLRQSMLYEELMARRPLAQKKVAKAPVMTKSGAPKSRTEVVTAERRTSEQRFAKAPSIDSAIDLLMTRQNLAGKRRA